MARIKSLGAGAKRAGEATTSALRKLFGRQPPAAGSCNNSSFSGADDSDASKSNEKKPGDGGDGGGSAGNNDRSITAAATLSEHPSLGTADASKKQLNTAKNARSQGQRTIGEDPADDTLRSVPATTWNHDCSLINGDGTAANMNTMQSRKHTQTQTGGKENQPPDGAVGNAVASSMKKLSLGERPIDGAKAKQPEEMPAVPAAPEELTAEDKALQAEREKHLVFIEEALDMARLALKINETPVGCVLVHNDKVIARGMNATNITRNGTRHAEFMALCALLSYAPKDGPRSTDLRPKTVRKPDDETEDNASTASPALGEGNEDGSKSHLYPYGQKEHPDERVDRSIIRECTLYVTVEPCVMCASLLRQLGIKKVFFGAVNDKFGGTGGVFSIHANSLPVREDGQTASAHPQPPPMRLPNGNKVLGTSFPPGGGDGGNVESGYEIEGGWGRDEAVGLLRRFYVQENNRAPVPRKKEGRAARLAALMDKDDNASVNSGSGGNGTVSDVEEPATEEGQGKALQVC